MEDLNSIIAAMTLGRRVLYRWPGHPSPYYEVVAYDVSDPEYRTLRVRETDQNLKFPNTFTVEFGFGECYVI